MARILIVAEHAAGRLNVSTAKCVACAATIAGAHIDIAVLAQQGEAVAAQAATLRGVSKVLKLDHPANAQPLAAVWAPQLAALATNYTHVFGPSTTFGKDLMPRLAALLGVGQLSDIMAAESAHRYRRPMYAGNVIATVEAAQDRVLVATVRTASFQPAPQGGCATVVSVEVNAELPTHTKFVARTATATDRPDLQTASRVVSGGRALGSADNFKMILQLADALSAAAGASRAAVDAGYAASDLQVGQTGKIIAPELYVAVGISGAIQHLTGIKDARTIVAINKDAEAPIFEVADIGLVADLFTVLPQFATILQSTADAGDETSPSA